MKTNMNVKLSAILGRKKSEYISVNLVLMILFIVGTVSVYSHAKNKSLKGVDGVYEGKTKNGKSCSIQVSGYKNGEQYDTIQVGIKGPFSPKSKVELTTFSDTDSSGSISSMGFSTENGYFEKRQKYYSESGKDYFIKVWYPDYDLSKKPSEFYVWMAEDGDETKGQDYLCDIK